MVAADFAVGPTYSLVIAGNTNSKGTKDMIQTIYNDYLPNKVLLLRKMEQENPDIDELSNFVQFFDDLDGEATAYVCINRFCKFPTNDLNKMLELLNAK